MSLEKRNIDDPSGESTEITATTADAADLPSAEIPIAIGDPAVPGAIRVSALLEYLQASLSASVLGNAWLTSASLVNGDLSESGTLEWTVAADAPTGVADGENTKCTIPLLPPDTTTFGWRVALLDSSNTVVDVVIAMWRGASEDITYFLKRDSTSYVTFKLQDIGTDTLVPTFSFSIENSDNGLTGHYLTISPISISI
ncbi:MAG: hypothetical protein V6Z81_06510 [Parvularculales bacterium]